MTQKINLVYFDMDGVLVDFDKSIEQLSGMSLSNILKTEFDYSQFQIKSKNPVRAIMEVYMSDGLFTNAPEMEGFNEFVGVMNWLNKNDVGVEILSSVTGEHFAGTAIAQKKEWLSVREIDCPQNYTKGSKHKSNYANENALLIDDFDRNVEQFTQAGGQGIHHTDINKTLIKLKNFFPEMTLGANKKKTMTV